jgi:predicted regulator of Ras-like GTPase activity (Roadblock/LC7/MglB family)
MSEDEDQQLIQQIEKLIAEQMENHVGILGISIGTELATNIITKFKPKVTDFTENELVASARSFQYISKNLYEHSGISGLKTTYVTVKDYVLLLILVKEISAAVLLDRKLAELEGIDKYLVELKALALKVSAFVETSDYMLEDPFLLIKRAIPSAKMIAIISKAGMPIKVESKMANEVMIGSMVSAISNLTNVMLKNPLDYSVLQGDGGSVLVVQFDAERILAIVIPKNEESQIGQYLARIKEIISKCIGLSNCDE